MESSRRTRLESRDKVRIGAVSYLNTRPLVLGMEQGIGAERIALSYGHPAALADRMVEGLLDVGLLPVIELARIFPLEIVSGLSISTRGPSRSVLLVGGRPPEQVRSVAFDPESRTSNALVQLLFAEVWKTRPTFSPGEVRLDQALDRCDATVRIGDKALFEPIPAGLHTVDLGQIWTAATGLPFVFAAWVARPGIVDRELYAILHESRRIGAGRIDQIALEYSWNGVGYPELAREYLGRTMRYRLGSDERRALRMFLGLARRHGLIRREPEMNLVGQGWSGDDPEVTPGALTAEINGGGASC